MDKVNDSAEIEDILRSPFLHYIINVKMNGITLS